MKVLIDALSKLPGGNFLTKTVQVAPLAKGLRMLGYDLRLSNGKASIRVSPVNEGHFFGALNQIEECLTPLLYRYGEKPRRREVLPLLAWYWAFGLGWCRAFDLCDDVEEFYWMWLHEFHSHAAAARIAPEDAVVAVRSWMAYEPMDYAPSA